MGVTLPSGLSPRRSAPPSDVTDRSAYKFANRQTKITKMSISYFEGRYFRHRKTVNCAIESGEFSHGRKARTWRKPR